MTVDTIHTHQSTAEYLPSFLANRLVFAAVVVWPSMTGDPERRCDASAEKRLSDISPAKQQRILRVLHVHPTCALVAEFHPPTVRIPIAATVFVHVPAGMKQIDKSILVAVVPLFLQRRAAQ